MALMNVVTLKEDERKKFAQAIYDARKRNLNWKAAIKEARLILPEESRPSERVDHPTKLKWLMPMLEQLEKYDGTSVLQKQNANPSTEHRLAFAEEVFRLKNENPKLSQADIIQRANHVLPEKLRYSHNLTGFRHLPWMLPMLEELSKNKASRRAHKQPLSAQQKNAFAKEIYRLKSEQPNISDGLLIQKANLVLPEDCRFSQSTVGLSQIEWLNSEIEKILESSENTDKPTRLVYLTDSEKNEFAEIVYKLRKGGATWTRAIREANEFLPEGRKIGKTINGRTQIPWLEPCLQKIEEADTNRRVIDHRNSLPKADDSVFVKPERKHHKSSAKTYLSDEDKMYFAEIAYQLRKINPGWGWHKILNEANDEMPVHKRRAKMPPSPSQIPWLIPLFDKISARPPERYIPEPEVAAAPAPAPAMDLQSIVMAAIQNAAQGIVASALQNGNLASVPGLSNTVQTTEKPKKKKIVVVGLLSVQTQNINKQFGHKFNFKFIGANTPSQQIKDAMKHADVGIIMTQFTPHSAQAAMRSHPGFQFCNGNSTALENLLETIEP